MPKRRPRGPVIVRVVNCQAVSAPPAKVRDIFDAALTERGRYGRPRVVLGCEAFEVDAETRAELFGFEAVQFGIAIVRGKRVVDTARAGSFVAWDTDHASALGRPRLLLASAAGEGIQARHLVQQRLAVNGHRAHFGAGHRPPNRAPRGQQAFLDRIRRYAGVIGADFNDWPGEMAQHGLGRQYAGVALLGALIPRRIPHDPARPIDVGGDHKAVDIRLWPTTTKE